MEDQKDISKKQPTGTGYESPPLFKPLGHRELGAHLGVTRQRAWQLDRQLVTRLQDLLIEDPYVREWLSENEVDLHNLDDQKARRDALRNRRASRRRP